MNADRTSESPAFLTGRIVKHRLLDLGKRQSWLIEQLKMKNENMYMDSSYMARLLNGQETSAPKMELIDQILSEEEERQKCSQNS